MKKLHFLLIIPAIVICISCKKEEANETLQPSDIPFINGNIVTDVNGNIYKTVTIGTQTWMAENLRATTYPNGDPIMNGTEISVWGNLPDNNYSDAFCMYDNDPINVEIYGNLYTYAAAIGDNWLRDKKDNQGVCPDGWHLPSDSEWKTLESYIGMGDSVLNDTLFRGIDEGNRLKSKHYFNVNDTIADKYGFNALLGGERHNTLAAFSNINNIGSWWCATEDKNDDGLAYIRSMYIGANGIYRNSHSKSVGYSVRCVKDIE